MKRFNFVLISLVFTLLGSSLSAQKKGDYVANPADADYLVDAKLDEWVKPLDFVDANTKVSYALANSATHLYFVVMISDEAMKLKALRGGITFAVDTLGKKKVHFSIKFPIPDAASQQSFQQRERPADGQPRAERREGEAGQGQQRERVNPAEAMRKRFQDMPKRVELVGFKEQKGVLPLDSVNVISIKMDWDEYNAIVFEGAIPFTAFRGSNIGAKDFAKGLNMILTINGMELTPEMKDRIRQMEERIAERQMSGGGGMGGGMMFINVSGSGGAIYESNIIEKKFFLSR